MAEEKERNTDPNLSKQLTVRAPSGQLTDLKNSVVR